MVWQLSKHEKNNRIFGGRFFAKLQSVVISLWSLCFFLHLLVCSPKAIKAIAAIKNYHKDFVN